MPYRSSTAEGFRKLTSNPARRRASVSASRPAASSTLPDRYKLSRVACSALMPSARVRSRKASTASRDRRQIRSARSRPIRVDNTESGVSISYCSNAVDAAVEPWIAPRLSTIATFKPASLSASAIIEPEMPAPTTRMSHDTGALKGDDGMEGKRRSNQTDLPVRRSRFMVADIVLSLNISVTKPQIA